MPPPPNGVAVHTPHTRDIEPHDGMRGLPLVHRYTIEVEGLDPAHDGLRIVHLTDLHVGLLTPNARILRGVAVALREQPDLVVMTGDFVCYSPRYVSVLQDVVSGIPGPVACVLGNHDYWTDGERVAKALEHDGYAVLRNESTRVTLRGAPLELVGIDDAVTGHADARAAFKGIAHTTKVGSPTRIVLTHVPGMADRAVTHGAGLVLAGHTHGGQVHIPRVTDRLAAVLGRPYLKGFFHLEDSTLFVNCGVGASAIPVRAGAPAEVAVITLRAREATEGRVRYRAHDARHRALRLTRGRP